MVLLERGTPRPVIQITLPGQVAGLFHVTLKTIFPCSMWAKATHQNRETRNRSGMLPLCVRITGVSGFITQSNKQTLVYTKGKFCGCVGHRHGP